jgi:adenylate cyclase
VLSSVCRDKKTCWEVPPAAQGASLVGVKAVVAAPILNRAGEVIGAVYGDRRQGGGRAGPITRLEAMLVSLLASGVAAGLARVEQEQAALRARVQFEQFFTPELSRHLEAEPRLLEGKDMEVTVLFCDIRRFSRVSERLGPARTGEWVGDVLNTLTRCVLAHEGTLVDYVGDELIAMWGAPVGQPDQAERASRAALDMLGKLPELSQRWQATLQEPVEVGIGLNTGVARVGNMGSDIKFKYGPLGNTINLGSRVQGATKYLKARLLITGATQARLGPDLRCRRLCRVRVVNINEPIELYELMGPGASEELKRGYEEALEQFEKKLFRPAARILGRLLAEYPEDGPTLLLNARVAHCLLEGTAHFDPVWELPGK